MICCYPPVVSNIACGGGHHCWLSYFNGEVFNVLWFYRYTGTPLYSRSDGLVWFAISDFLGNHVFVHWNVQAGDISLKTCPWPGSNPQPCALQSTALTTRPTRLYSTLCYLCLFSLACKSFVLDSDSPLDDLYHYIHKICFTV